MALCTDPEFDSGRCETGSLAASWTASSSLGLWQPCVFVSNDHGEALAEWLAVAAEQRFSGKLSVLHIDKHNDLNVPEHPEVFQGHWLEDGVERDEIARSVDLVNFQLAAVWVGLVNRIIWVKQGGGSSSECPDGFASSLKLNRASQNFEEGIPRCEGEVSPEEADGNVSVAFLAQELYDAELLEPLVVQKLVARLREQPYILDLDLDFFVWGASTPEPRPAWIIDGQNQSFLDACRRWTDPECSTMTELAQRGVALETWALDEQSIANVFKLSPAEQLLLAQQLRRRRPRTNVEKVQEQFRRLSLLLHQLQDSPPVLVTIARSTDRYARLVDIPLLESMAMKLLGSVWGPGEERTGSAQETQSCSPDDDLMSPEWPCVRYARGTSSLERLLSLQRVLDRTTED